MPTVVHYRTEVGTVGGRLLDVESIVPHRADPSRCRQVGQQLPHRWTGGGGRRRRRGGLGGLGPSMRLLVQAVPPRGRLRAIVVALASCESASAFSSRVWGASLRASATAWRGATAWASARARWQVA